MVDSHDRRHDGHHEELGSEGDSDADPSQLSETYLVGFVLVNIVGLQYYNGTINGREMVGLVREPLNPYDPNAIKVLNTRTVQVGHIQRDAAAVLAPLIDSRMIIAEGIVPKPPKNRNPYRLPCQVHIFARMEAVEVVRTTVFEGGLVLVEGEDHEFGLSEAVVVQEKKKKDDGGRSMDEIFALVGKVGDGASLAMEPDKDVIVTELFTHQKEALGWMVSRESNADLPPFWEAKDGGFMNVLTNHLTESRPQPLKGGIFADDMGLGKTLTLLSLIASNRSPVSGVIASSSSMVGGKVEHAMTTGRKSKRGNKPGSSRNKRQRKNDGSSVTNGSVGPYSTLVVCPPSVFSTWITQLEEHTSPGSFKVYLYHGERTRDASKLSQKDIILTTYSTLSSEFGSSDSPLKEIEWFRVILDEAHLIKNFAAQQTQACIALKAERRWVVTGTPIQNNSFDLFSLMAFLRFEPFSIKSYWRSLVQRPLDQGNKSGMSRLQALIGTISLRRTKDPDANKKSLVGLPSKSIETCFVDLSSNEREQYDQLESEAQSMVQDYISSDTVTWNYLTVLQTILRLRQVCNDVGLCPADIRSMLPAETLEDASNNPELLKKLVAAMQDGDDFDCPICLSPPTKMVITSCTHIFCQACVMKILKQVNNARCPICRSPLAKANLFLVPPQASADVDKLDTTSNRPVSSKVSMLLKLLSRVKERSPSTKSVVFSQFRRMLLLLEEPLRVAGFSFLRLDGSMSTRKRTEVIREFSKTDPSSPTILLASLQAAGAGINLTAASRVYIVEPWWNPGVEEQAMNRVHRIGQQNEVKVVRLIVRESIEERILELQEKKKKLASGAFGRRASSKEEKQVSVEDLRAMVPL